MYDTSFFFLDSVRPSIDYPLFNNMYVEYLDFDNQLINRTIIDGFFFEKLF